MYSEKTATAATVVTWCKGRRPSFEPPYLPGYRACLSKMPLIWGQFVSAIFEPARAQLRSLADTVICINSCGRRRADRRLSRLVSDRAPNTRIYLLVTTVFSPRG